MLNIVAPGPVDTPISEITKKSVPIEQFTPMSLLVQSLDRFLDEDITGKVIECSNKNMYIREPVEFADENAKILISDMERF